MFAKSAVPLSVPFILEKLVIVPPRPYVPAPDEVPSTNAPPLTPEFASVKLFTAPGCVDPVNVYGVLVPFDWSVLKVVVPVLVEIKMVNPESSEVTAPLVLTPYETTPLATCRSPLVRVK